LIQIKVCGGTGRKWQMSGYVMQRLADPELCTACFGCYEVCPKGAIVIERRRIAVDPDLCAHCGDCVGECSTGAIEVLRKVPAEACFPVAEQLGWNELPPEDFD
jgi:benzoyl-CoA 2,3-dioxygenase component A